MCYVELDKVACTECSGCMYFFNSIGFVCSVRWRNGSIKQLKTKKTEERHHTTRTMNIEHHKVNSSFKQLS